ncbi:MAG TPA: restriction endonuclease [Thermoanaerobaculia bacterium]
MAIAADYESRILGFEREGLLELWRAIERRDTPDWEQGKALEYLILRAFQLEGAVVRWPYTAQLFGEDVEQIDGVIYWQDLKCLVEVKDTERPIALAPVAKLRNQLQRRPAETLGLLFSRAGFTRPASVLAQFSSPQAILLWSGAEIEYSLLRGSLCQSLLMKYRKCVEEGTPDFDIRERKLA